MPSRLLLATNNAGKLAEYDVLLEGCGWEVVTPRDLGIDIEVEETGETYEANATIKARRGSEASGLVTLADDSGIEIEAMGGDPGVHSARFRCVIAVADPRTGAVRTAEGEVFGQIAEAPAGEGGFGYDPIFWLPQHSATMAELPEHQKNIVSHRARAVAGARQILKELLYEHERT